MPRLVPIRLVAACALALMLVLSLTAVAAAKGPLANLRVVGTGGKILAEDSFGVGGEATIKTSSKATCFGAGTGGSGKSVTVGGSTALGMLIRAAQFTAALKPTLISDHFDFGLALCGLGKSVAGGKSSWYLKLNHKNPEIGGESVKLHAGDEVLWALAGFPYPQELSLIAPDGAQANMPFQVRVFSYDDKGKKKPASGVTVTGASGPTDSSGRATVTLSKAATLTARHGTDIPSNREAVCVGGKCPGISGK